MRKVEILKVIKKNLSRIFVPCLFITMPTAYRENEGQTSCPCEVYGDNLVRNDVILRDEYASKRKKRL